MKDFVGGCMMTIGALLAISLIAVFAFLYFTMEPVIVAALTALINGFVLFTQIAAVVSLACLAAIVAVIVWGKWSKRRNDNRRQLNGSFPVREFKDNAGRTHVVSPSEMPGGSFVFDPKLGVQPITLGLPHDVMALLIQTNNFVRGLQAAYAGDDVLGEIGAQVQEPKLAGSAIKPQKPPSVKVLDPEPPRLIAPGAMIPDAVTAAKESKPDAWILGQAGDGAIATYNPKTHVHIGIVGASGTRKTTSAGFGITAQAIRHGFHALIFDPDGGEDWGGFAGHAEHIETDSGMILEQISRLYDEYNRRSDESQRARPLFIVIEEFGDLFEGLKQRDKQGASNADFMLDRIMRRGRKRGMHVCLIDQYPEKWTPNVLSNTKQKAVFQLHDGAKLKEYHAHELADHSEFLYRGARYNSFSAYDKVPALLEGSPPLNGYRVIDAQPVRDGVRDPVHKPFIARSPEVAPPTPAPVNGTNTPAQDNQSRWGDLVARWFQANPQAKTGKAQGITAIARQMSVQATGNQDAYANYKSVAHELFHAYRADPWPAPGEAAPTVETAFGDAESIDMNTVAGRTAAAALGQSLIGKDVKVS